jgi:hypothetical protein
VAVAAEYFRVLAEPLAQAVLVLEALVILQRVQHLLLVHLRVGVAVGGLPEVMRAVVGMQALLVVKQLILMAKLLLGLAVVQYEFMGALHDSHRRVFKKSKCLR